MHKLPCHDFAQLVEHRFEQYEGFGLVLVERVALTERTETDDLAQMFERDQVFTPQMIENLEQDRLFNVAHAGRADRCRRPVVLHLNLGRPMPAPSDNRK